jgi:tRNA/rRNA methyltransferase
MVVNRINLNNIHVVLHRPKYPENIGSAARAMWNMGLQRLVVVNPENYNLEKILTLSTHEAAHVVHQALQFDSLPEALSGCQYVVGTTARLGKQRQVIRTPEELAAHLIPISRKNSVAVVFGPEDKGLSNEDVRYCHALLNIPTAAFASVNLAQAVMIVCYALQTAGLDAPLPFVPRLASRHELDGMYAQLKDMLVRISYINSENPDYFMNNFRRFFTRMQLRAKEVSLIRGICRQVDWYAEKRYRDGLSEQRAMRDE